MKCDVCQTEILGDSLICPVCSRKKGFSETTLSVHDGTNESVKDCLDLGSLFARKYEIEEWLGGGGMGVVYKAKDIALDRPVALKFMKPEITLERSAVRRFIREARAASTLDHQNLCTIHEIQRTDGGQLCIAMAYYPGATLRKKIKSGPLPVREALDIVIQISQGLSAAHREGIIHRDIKPDNVIITDQGIIKIVDFGLAMLADTRTDSRASEIVGTPVYMSPEQTLGNPTSFQTDVWAVGVIFYEMLTGRRPHEGKSHPSLRSSIFNEDPPSPRDLNPQIPDELGAVVMRCLEKSPQSRFASATDLAKSLVDFRKSLEQSSFPASEEDVYEGKETERRLATFLRVELQGYSRLMDVLDPETAASHLTDFTNLAWEVIRKYGGRTSRITGSRFSAYFGVPIALEDAPIMAVNAAIELRNGLEALNRKRELPIQLGLRAGIDTGMVIAGIVATGGSKGYSVTGPAVTNASEYAGNASQGWIVVGESTYRQTKSAFRFKTLRTISMSRKGDSRSAYQLLSTHEEIHRLSPQNEGNVESPMVGRGRELAQLHHRLEDVVQGSGAVVSVVGEAGLGKSRLIAEFSQSKNMKGVTLLKGRALSIGRNLSFHPIIDLLRNWAGVKEGDSPDTSSAQVRDFVSRIAPRHIDDIFPFIATLMGLRLSGRFSSRIIGIEGEALEKLVLKSLKDLVTLASKTRPLVIVFEDLHWADATSLEILESLFRLASSNPVLFVVVCRSGIEETSGRLLRHLRDLPAELYTEVNLESLDDQTTESLLQNLLNNENLPMVLKRAIIPRSGGNPFFVEEIVRSLIDQRILVPKNVHFMLTETIDSLHIPETLNEVVMSRIDRLDPETRSLLKIAAVIGRNFFYRILAEVATSVPSIDEKISHLKQVQLICETSRMEEVEYLFKHALVQQVTYESMLFQQRRDLHFAIARAIENVFGNRLHEFFGMLAYHYGRAERLEEAEVYMIKAGEEALRSSASNEALHYYSEALEIYMKKSGADPDRRKVAMLEKNIALALFNKARFEEADPYFERVLTFYGERFPKSSVGVAAKSLLGLASFLLRLNFRSLQGKKLPSQSISDFINLFFKKDTGLVVADPKRMVVECFYWLKFLLKYDIEKIENGIGILSLSSGTFSYSGLSFNVAEKIQQYAHKKVDESDPKSVMYDKVAEVLIRTFGGNWKQFPDFEEALVDRCVKVGEVFYTSSYLFTLGIPYIERGCEEKIKNIVKKGRGIAVDLEHDFAGIIMQQLETILLLKYRRLREAARAAQDGIEQARTAGYPASTYYFWAYTMTVQVLMRDFVGAEQSLKHLNQIRSGLRVTPYHNSPFLLGRFQLALARLEEREPNERRRSDDVFSGNALQFGRQAVRNSRLVAYDRVQAYRLMGRYWWLADRQKKALRWWNRSFVEAERLEVPLEMARTSLEVGRRLGDDRSRHAALNGLPPEHYLSLAGRLMKMHGLSWDLDRAENEISGVSALWEDNNPNLVEPAAGDPI